MTISPADALRAVFVAALIAWPALATAQDAPAGETATGAPRQLQGGPAPQAPETAPSPATQSPDNSAITVAPLGSTEGAPAGLLDVNNGGLGTNIWSGSPRAEIDRLLADLPIATPVYSERELARRLLLTIADAPVGAAPHAFLTLRLEELLKAGFVLEASIIAANAQVTGDAEYAHVAADAILFAGHAGDACGNATAARLSNGDKFWMELRAYCYAVVGNEAALDLTRSVMAAQNEADPAFDTLLDDVLHHKAADPGPIPNPTSLDFFLLEQAGLPIDSGLAKQLGMPALVAALDNTKAPAEDRASVAEDVLRAGAMPMAHLMGVADAQTFNPEQLADAANTASTLPFFMGQALLRRAALHAEANDTKTTLVIEALRLGIRAHIFGVSAGMQADIAASLAAGVAKTDDAELIARALMLAGNFDAAARWRDTIDAGKFPAIAAELNVDLALSAPAHGTNVQGALGALAGKAATPPDFGRQEFAALAFGLYDALGEPLPPEAKAAETSFAAMQWPGRRPPDALMARLAEAAGSPDRKGEALLLVLAAIGADGPGDLAPDVTVKLVRTLADEGVPDAARGVATDALLLYEPAPAPPPPAPPPAAAPAP